MKIEWEVLSMSGTACLFRVFALSGFRDSYARVAWLVVALALVGCGGPKKVTVTGSVVRGGQAIKLGPTGTLLITLMPDVAAGEDYTSRVGECDKEGKFAIGEVLPGKYKVGVEQFDPTPQMDKLNGAFSAAGGKIVRELDGKGPVVIDLDKPGL